MTTNTQGTRQNSRPGESTTGETTPVVSATGVGGVQVYDTEDTTNSTLRPSASMVDDRASGDTRSSGSVLTWIIGAIILIVLAYFLMQYVF